MYKGSNPKDHQPYVRLLGTAETLFLERGFRATGVNALLNEAGVARQTLYNHFSSKDGLIEAVLRFKSKKVLSWLKGRVDWHRSEAGADPLAALFHAFAEWFEEPDFRGCLFARAANEYPEPNHPAHKIAAAHTSKLFTFLDQLAKETSTTLPCPGEHLLLLVEGATAVAAKTGAGKAAAERAHVAAVKLLKP